MVDNWPIYRNVLVRSINMQDETVTILNISSVYIATRFSINYVELVAFLVDAVSLSDGRSTCNQSNTDNTTR